MIPTDDRPYHVHLGDVIPYMATLPPESVAFSIYSPPFPSVYSYTSKYEDIGNSEDLRHEARLHFSFFFRAIRRVMQPGRVMIVHCTQIVRMKRAGGEGMFDFRGLLIRLAERAGFIYDFDWAVRKNPQAQAIRTRSRSLQFKGLETDRAQSRGAMPDFLIKFNVPGINEVPIDSKGQVTRNQWIDWAEFCWDDITESDTLNTAEAKSEEDCKHICPLQLKVIERMTRLFSNPGELVFSPFAGIGSEGYVALKLGRRFLGAELKPEYHATALKNLDRAVRSRREKSRTLFDAIEPDPSPDPEPADPAEATA